MCVTWKTDKTVSRFDARLATPHDVSQDGMTRETGDVTHHDEPEKGNRQYYEY